MDAAGAGVDALAGALALLAGIPQRAGFGFSPGERLLLNRPPYIRPHRGTGNWVYPEVSAFCIAHGLVDAPVVPRMAVRPEALAAAAQDLAGVPGPLYAFSIGTSAPRNNWGGERFAVLAQALAERGCSVLLLGGPAERDAAAAIVAAVAPALRARVIAATQPSVQHSAALLRHCQFCVGNDTSALNMAVANGVPALWTVDDIAQWLQLSVSSVKQSVVVRPGFPAPVMPTGVDGAAKRWLASEVTQWVMQHRAQLPRGRG